MVDSRLHDRFLNVPRTFRRLCCSDCRSWDLNNFTSYNRTWRFRVHVRGDLTLEAQAFNRLPTACTQLVVAWTLIYDGRVTVSDIGDVCRLIDDRHVALGRNEGCLNATRAKLIRRNETVLVRADVVIIVSPVMNTGAAIKTRFGRQRRPADIIIILAPRHPGGRPFISGDPNPSDVAQPRPAPVMVGCPAERLFRYPGPARVCVNPAAVGVRTPRARALRLARLPDIPVVRGLTPHAIWLEFPVKGRIGRGRYISKNVRPGSPQRRF